MISHVKKYIGRGLLSLFMAYTAFLTIFYHVDVVNGEMVAHAHFYKLNQESGAPSHDTPHTTEQLIFLQQLSCISTFGGSIIQVFDFRPIQGAIELFFVCEEVIAEINPLLLHSLRGPPASF